MRKILGQHEIATVQTTSMDQAAGIINLTTLLAHASGEWIASDWPVCAISETTTPRRMGAALTYARRYALFTLVGIAGEDDLDAPDLTTATDQRSVTERPEATSNDAKVKERATQQTDVRRDADVSWQSVKPIFKPEAAAELRDRLIAEMNDLGSSDEAATWAHRSLGEKNRLTAADALRVEEVFQSKLANFAAPVAEAPQTRTEAVLPPSSHNGDKAEPKKQQRSKPIDKSILTLPEPRRVRDREHVRFVARHSCLVCGRLPSDAHHLRFVQSRALGRKVSDEFTVPLCRGHHREVHRCGDEAAWWSNAGIEATVTARALWLETHPLPPDQGKPA